MFKELVEGCEERKFNFSIGLDNHRWRIGIDGNVMELNLTTDEQTRRLIEGLEFVKTTLEDFLQKHKAHSSEK